MVKGDGRAGAIKSEANFTAFLTFGPKILYIKKKYNCNILNINRMDQNHYLLF